MPELTFGFGVYTGAVDADGLRHGPGELRYNNGNYVKGEWVKGALTCAEGAKTFANGDAYVGGFLNGAKHGGGVYTFRQGGRYAGQYAADKPHGAGRWEGAGEVYEGEYHNGQRNGRGVETVTDRRTGALKTRYDGVWVNGKKHGEGTLYFADGTCFKGKFVGDKPQQAEGAFYNADGTPMTDGGAEDATASAPTPAPRAAARHVEAQPAPAAPTTASGRPASMGTTAAASSAPPTGDADMAAMMGAMGGAAGGNEQTEAMTRELMNAFSGMNDFGENLTKGLDKATAGLDALEAQLDMLTSAFGIDEGDLVDDDAVAGGAGAALPGMRGAGGAGSGLFAPTGTGADAPLGIEQALANLTAMNDGLEAMDGEDVLAAMGIDPTRERSMAELEACGRPKGLAGPKLNPPTKKKKKAGADAAAEKTAQEARATGHREQQEMDRALAGLMGLSSLGDDPGRSPMDPLTALAALGVTERPMEELERAGRPKGVAPPMGTTAGRPAPAQPAAASSEPPADPALVARMDNLNTTLADQVNTFEDELRRLQQDLRK